MNKDQLELQLALFKLEVLQEIIHLLPQTGDPWKTLNFIMNRIFALVEMEGASLILPDETGQKLVFKIVRGEKESELVGKTMEIDKGIAGKTFTTGEIALVQDTAKDAAFSEDIDNMTGYQTRSILVVPVRSEDKVLGVLEGVNLDVEEIENPAELTGLFESLADLIAVVLSNYEIRQNLTEDSVSVARLLDVSRAVNSTLELSDVLDAVINAAKRIIGCEASSLLLLDDEGKNLIFFVASGEKKAELETQKFPVEHGIAGYVARSGKPVISNDAKSDDRFDSSFDEDTGFDTRSLMCVPMYQGGRVFGVLEAINK
ncbi:GAF domain-containing protein, partial [bacterium]